MGFKYQIYNIEKAHYLTITVVNWIDVFTRKIYRDAIIDSLKYCQANKGLKIYAYVIMSNHIHLVASADNLSDWLRDFKKYTSYLILKTIKEEPESRREWMLNQFAYRATLTSSNTNYKFWAYGNHPVELYSNKFIAQKINYLHQNPVRAGIVENAEDYLYSSARNYADLESIIEINKIEIRNF